MKALHTLILFVLPFLISAQNNEGRIVYDETIRMEIDIPEEHREQLKAILPDSRTTKKELLFNDRESIYKDVEGENNEETHEIGSEESGMHMKMVIQRPDNRIYKNIEKNEVFEKQELFGKDFLIIDQTSRHKWKLLNEQKDILGYTCQKASFEKDDNTIVAWYSTEIPVSNGPMNYGHLPGMILELNIGDGQTHILASEIVFRKLENGDIKAPGKGKKVSREEYEKIVEEKQKEMEEEYGGQGRMIIKTHRY